MIVIIDNYDSFTYNIVQYFQQMTEQVVVFRNDQFSIDDMYKLDPTLIVLSPGPGTPADSGLSGAVVERFYQEIPLLGICLGHQIIVNFFGGEIVKGKHPVHGKVTPIHHNQLGIYHNIPNPTEVTRYHSLVANDANFPAQLKINARSLDGAIMSVQHNDLPINGIQFHPESIRTSHGFQILKNCYQQALDWKREKRYRL